MADLIDQTITAEGLPEEEFAAIRSHSERLAEIRDQSRALADAAQMEFAKPANSPYEHGVAYYLAAGAEIARAVPALLDEVDRLRKRAERLERERAKAEERAAAYSHSLHEYNGLASVLQALLRLAKAGALDTLGEDPWEHLDQVMQGRQIPAPTESDRLRNQLAEFAADVNQIIAEYSHPEQDVIAKLPFAATLDQIAHVKYGISLNGGGA